MPSSLLEKLQTAIRGEGLDGWLFYNFRHRDRLADEILGLDVRSVSSRPWIYAVPAIGEALKLVHAIEPANLDSLDGVVRVYSGAADFTEFLRPLAGKRWGVHFSETLPIISYLDYGAANRIAAAGLRLVSAAALIQRLKGLLDSAGVSSHLRANAALHDLIRAAWAAVGRSFRDGVELREGDIRKLLMDGLAARNLVTDHPPIVATGAHSGDPHYDFKGPGERFAPGDCIQLDIWAKEPAAGAIYADISWVGVYDTAPDPRYAAAFATLSRARDSAITFICGELELGRRPTGAAVDDAVRRILSDAGYAAALRHRTGHGIDTECHGSGVNLDAFEFPDDRRLLDGSCFSIEPGLYFNDFGLRTEIDARVEAGRVLVSGPTPQTELLVCGIRP